MTVDSDGTARDCVPSSDVLRQIDPVGFYGKFLRAGVRPDGRRPEAFRMVGVSNLLQGSASSGASLDEEGVEIASVRLTAGETHIHCVAKAVPSFCDVSVGAAGVSDPLVSVEVELPKQVQPYIHDVNGPCANLNFCVSHLLETVLNARDVLPASQLRLHELLHSPESATPSDIVCSYMLRRQFSWKIAISVFCEEYDGNLVDMSVMSVSFALRGARLPIVLLEFSDASGVYVLRRLDLELLDLARRQDPKVGALSLLILSIAVQALKLLLENRRLLEAQLSIELSEASVVGQLSERLQPLERVGVPLALRALPFTVTFLRFDANTWLVDPTKEEERLGVSVSIYCLREAGGAMRTQLLNLLGCPGITGEVLDDLEEAASGLIDYIANTEV